MRESSRQVRWIPIRLAAAYMPMGIFVMSQIDVLYIIALAFVFVYIPIFFIHDVRWFEYVSIHTAFRTYYL